MVYTISTNGHNQELDNFLSFTESYIKNQWKDVTVEKSPG